MNRSLFNSMTLFMLFIFSICVFIYTVFHINIKKEFYKNTYSQSPSIENKNSNAIRKNTIAVNKVKNIKQKQK